MPQVSLLAVDVAQAPDIKGALSSYDSSIPDDGQAFSRLVEQHIISEKGGKIIDKKEMTGGNTSSEDGVEAIIAEEFPVSEDAQSDTKAQLDGDGAEVNAAKLDNDDGLTESEKFIALLNASEKTLITSTSAKADADQQSATEQEKAAKNEVIKNEQLAQALKKSDEMSDKLTQQAGNTKGSVEGNNAENDDHRDIANQTDFNIKGQKNKRALDSGENAISAKTITIENNDDATEKVKSVNNDVINNDVDIAKIDKNNKAPEAAKIDSLSLANKNDTKLNLANTQSIIDTANIKDKVSDVSVLEPALISGGNEDEINADATVNKNAVSTNKNISNLQQANDVVSQQIKANAQVDEVDSQESSIIMQASVEKSHLDKTMINQQSAVDAKANVVNVIHQSTTPSSASNSSRSDEQGTGSQNNANSDSFTEVKLEVENAESDAFAQMSAQAKNTLANNGESLVASSSVDRPNSTHNSAHLSSAQQNQFMEAMASRESRDSLNIHKPLSPIQTETIAIYSKDFSNAVKEKVMVMINQKLQQVDIQLDPPELGNVSVRVNLQGEQAAVNFIVQNQQAKDALEQNMPRLREMLAEKGVDVGDANIEQSNQQTADDGSFSNSSSQDGSFDENEFEEQQSANIQQNLFKASSTGVDYYA
ncbi:flagellar hook-length control protein FliK [Colwelliaceae bacterium 6471]